MQLERYEDALKLVDKALSVKGQKLKRELIFEKGVALEKTGSFDDAFDIFKSYIEDYPNDEEALDEYDFLTTRISDEKAEQANVSNGNN